MAGLLPLPPQLSTDPLVNASAMAWAGQLVDALQKVFSGTDSSLSFLQLAVPGSHKVAFGSASTTYPGASNFSNTMTIAHGLGATPTVVLALSNSTTASVEFVWQAAAPGSTNISLRTANPFVAPAGGTVTGCYWLAIA